MSTSTADPTNNKTMAGGTSSQAQPTGAERRRRKRVKISGHVHVRAKNCPTPFEEVCKSVDVSRDGVLFSSSRAGYWKGQLLDVTFPYSSANDTWNQPQSAEVVRIDEQPDMTYGIAVQFHAAKGSARTKTTGAESDPYRPGISARGAAAARQTTPQQVVLAVESDPRMADVMRSVLKPDGYIVLVVPTAAAALEILRTTVPAAFIAEVETEGISGLDLCMIVKREERLKCVPVILVTRAANPADYSASQEMGAVVCMAKPFMPEKLLQVVRLVAPPPRKQSAYGTSISGGTIVRDL